MSAGPGQDGRAVGIVVVAVGALILGGSVAADAFEPRDTADAACVETLAALPPDASVAGYGPVQLDNARAIIAASDALGAPDEAGVIAVMTAMGESGLRVLDHGDRIGPDSRGLFQQRANGAWGSYEDRMDPTTSATSFLTALLRLPSWEELPPTVAAHRVQVNADEQHYARYEAPAREVYARLTGHALECAGG